MSFQMWIFSVLFEMQIVSQLSSIISHPFVQQYSPNQAVLHDFIEDCFVREQIQNTHRYSTWKFCLEKVLL